MDNKFLTFLREDGFWHMVFALLYDTLILSLLAFAGLMTLEALIPGFISVHINLAKIVFGISLLLFAYAGIGYAKNITLSSRVIPKWFKVILLLWSSLLILNALIKFPLYAIVIIFLLTAVIGKLLYDEFFMQ